MALETGRQRRSADMAGISRIRPSVDHYFQFSKKKSKKQRIAPMGTFDHLIISMGIHLAHIHGRENVLVVSTDDRSYERTLVGRQLRQICREGTQSENCPVTA